MPFAPIMRTLWRLVNSILPILSDLFLMKLNNSFICYVISFPNRSNETLTLNAVQTSWADVSGLSVMRASLDVTQRKASVLLWVSFLAPGTSSCGAVFSLVEALWALSRHPLFISLPGLLTATPPPVASWVTLAKGLDLLKPNLFFSFARWRYQKSVCSIVIGIKRESIL